MEKDRKEPYIRQKGENEYLYTRLQRQTLEEVQRLSGKVWTNFNVHDPGVTLADISNYALTELDYKLSFNLEDYLTEKGGTFEPERFGLFPPEEVYTTAPVTTEDYRRLFFSYIPELENVCVKCDMDSGGYTVSIVLPFFGESNEKEVTKRVKELYNGHRNLCEHLDKVVIVKPEELEFHAEFEIEPGKDASVVLAQLYWTILHYLSGTVSTSTPEELAASGIPPEEWLEGSETAVRVVIPQQQNTEYELYQKLWQVEGIKSFSTCYLMKDGEPLTDFTGGFSLKIPGREKELKVCIRCGRSTVKVDMERFRERLKALYFSGKRASVRDSATKKYNWGVPEGTYRDIFTHAPIAGDFPVCYRLSPNRKTPTSFEAYLQLYDKVIKDGLKEVEELPRLLSLSPDDLRSLIEDNRGKRNIHALKSRYLDFLDRLYGVESQPAWLTEQDNYGETEEGGLRRRMLFLQHVAYLARNRAKARDITIPEGENNAPVVKEWFCRLLGIDGNEEHTVGNVLPGHHLELIEKKSDNPLLDRLDALLIDERILEPDNVIPVVYEELAADEKEKNEEYSQLRVTLPIFNKNEISGDLFRNGTSLKNYKIVRDKKDEYMLVFRNQERDGWTNLGRTDDPQRLNTLANILRRYLRELNRECETLYVVEPVLVESARPFRLQLVLPMWTSRFHTPRFREMCRELLRSLIPAHLTGNIYWLDEGTMQSFEHYYKQLMRTLADSELKNYGALLLKVIYELLEKAVETQTLDDTN